MSASDDKNRNRNNGNPFDIDGFEDMMKKFFGGGFRMPDFGFDMNFEHMENINPENIDQNGKFISYRFTPGMDKPEIRINGEPVDIDEEEIRTMFDTGNMMPGNMGFQPQKIPEIDASEISLDDGEPILNKEVPSIKEDGNLAKYVEPYSEMTGDGQSRATVVMELPSVKKDSIILNYYDNNVTITAEGPNKLYRKRIELNFRPDKGKTEVDGRNGIFEIKFSH